MKKSKKSLWIVALLGIFLLTLSGCSSKNSEETIGSQIRVAFWGSPEEVEIIKEVVGNWQKDNPEIKVILEHTPYS
jgi:ABC-type glycerol-3-phosphate transport system substrate-binding protein